MQLSVFGFESLDQTFGRRNMQANVFSAGGPAKGKKGGGFIYCAAKNKSVPFSFTLTRDLTNNIAAGALVQFQIDLPADLRFLQ